MFGLGIPELITIAIVILVLVNPKDLPVIVRKIGSIYGKIMKQINILKKTYSNFEQEVETVKSNIDLNKINNIEGVNS